MELCIILYLFSLFQKKCERYYPQFKEEPVTFGPFRISCVSKYISNVCLYRGVFFNVCVCVCVCVCVFL